MSKKSAMGHNPLDYRPLAEAKFEFIKQTDSGSEGGKTAQKKEESPNKKVVSYYLEEDLVEEIKRRAKEKEDSYSHFVSNILKRAIDD